MIYNYFVTQIDKKIDNYILASQEAASQSNHIKTIGVCLTQFQKARTQYLLLEAREKKYPDTNGKMDFSGRFLD